MKPWEQLKDAYTDYDTEQFVDRLVREDMEMNFKCPIEAQVTPQNPIIYNPSDDYQYLNALSQEMKQSIDNIIAKAQNLNADSQFFSPKDLISAFLSYSNDLHNLDEQLSLLNDVKNNASNNSNVSPTQQLIFNTMSL